MPVRTYIDHQKLVTSLLMTTNVKAGKFLPSLMPTPFSTVTTPTVNSIHTQAPLHWQIHNKIWRIWRMLTHWSILPSQRPVKNSLEETVGLSAQPWAAEAALGIQNNSQLYSVKQA